MVLETRVRSAAEEDQLIRDNMALAFYHLKKFGCAGDDEARSAALEGLWKAAQTYDASKGASFGTYASVCIYNSIGMYLRKLKRKRMHETISIDDNLCEGFTVADTLMDKDTPESLYLSTELISDMRKAYLRVLAKTTSDKQKRVITLWFESYGKMRQRDIAQATGFSQSYVSRVLGTIKHKIRQEMEDYV